MHETVQSSLLIFRRVHIVPPGPLPRPHRRRREHLRRGPPGRGPHLPSLTAATHTRGRVREREVVVIVLRVLWLRGRAATNFFLGDCEACCARTEAARTRTGVAWPQGGVEAVAVNEGRALWVVRELGLPLRVTRRPGVLHVGICGVSSAQFILASERECGGRAAVANAHQAQRNPQTRTYQTMLSSRRWPRNRACSVDECRSRSLPLPPPLPSPGLYCWSGAMTPAHSYADSPPASGVIGKLRPSPLVWGCGHSHSNGLGPSTALRFSIVLSFCCQHKAISRDTHVGVLDLLDLAAAHHSRDLVLLPALDRGVIPTREPEVVHPKQAHAEPHRCAGGKVEYEDKDLGQGWVDLQCKLTTEADEQRT